MVLPAPTPSRRINKATGEPYFGRDEFIFDDNDEVVCPSGKLMRGPYNKGDGSKEWRGRGCEDCPLRSACTPGRQRTIVVNPTTDMLHEAVRSRLAEPGGQERYNRRIATIEPVFSFIEDTMGFTRASSRMTKTVYAEVLLKAIAYNITRLLAAAARRASLRVVGLEFVVTAAEPRLVAVWLPESAHGA